MRRALVVLGLVLMLLVAIGVYRSLRSIPRQVPVPAGLPCVVRTGSGVVKLNTDQMANAATIAAVGLARHLPDRAVTVALATALQESELVNIAGGDRDSIGLFQQRPSQGWGSATDIIDPRYAANAFYNQLVKISGWQDMRITDAAQRVQRSAFPDAYDEWVDEATVLAEALVGDVGSAVSCTVVDRPAVRGPVATEALVAGLRLDWGDAISKTAAANSSGLTLSAADARAGWQYAHWLVAHSTEQGVARVRFADQEWTADGGAWKQVTIDPAGPARVVAVVYPS